jgi:hypothetical protein
MDMADIPRVFRSIDLLWSQGAAYNIGFAHALSTWADALAPGGFAVVSELSWLAAKPPAAVEEFFRTGYPDMRSVADNVDFATSAGYALLATHVLPAAAWVDGYYDILAPRAKALADHPDPGVREFARETSREIEIFAQSEASCGYVFYLLERRSAPAANQA